MATAKMKLGKFMRDNTNVLHGRISGLGIGSISVISEEALSLDGKSYLKLIADPLGEAYEVGAAFAREKDGMKYYSVNLESPVLPAPISAALFPDRGDAHSFNLVWNRPEHPKVSNDAIAENTAAQNAEPNGEVEKKASSRRRFASNPTP